MFAVLAVIAFAVAFLLHVATGPAKYVTDAEILGWLCIAAHLAFLVPLPWRRTAPVPPQ
jgi:hypothetical protein